MKALVLALCAACSLGGKRPSYDYFVLRSTHAPPPSQARSGAAVLVVDPVTIPGYLDREQIATRTADYQLVYSTRDRWAEPLDQGFARTLREELAARLAQTGIEVQSQGGTHVLGVDVQRFERSGPNYVELWARWSLRSDTELLDSGETRLRIAMSGRDSNTMAAALSEAIARMATEIANRVVVMRGELERRAARA